ncbi:hypothetical protein R1sor_015230 [Riccia sorocarpa]|uniref:Uncharacterized protein n=1 Tax=Riccia sorocarpa TaxID=122646 RepID=A0ABD3HDH9_9MARC
MPLAISTCEEKQTACAEEEDDDNLDKEEEEGIEAQCSQYDKLGEGLAGRWTIGGTVGSSSGFELFPTSSVSSLLPHGKAEVFEINCDDRHGNQALFNQADLADLILGTREQGGAKVGSEE